MIAYVKGYLAQLTPTHAVIESGGIGYHLNISLNTYSQIQGKGDVLLYTYVHISGGTQTPIVPSLFGFATESERETFVHLLSVSGVGASTVRLILSALQPQEVVSAIANNDVATFQRIKGIGTKTAQRLILELKDKMIKVQPGSTISAVTPGNIMVQEALSALIMLGFNRTQANQVLQKLSQQGNAQTVEGLIKEALKQL